MHLGGQLVISIVGTHAKNIAAIRVDRRFGIFLHDKKVKKYRRRTNGSKFFVISSWFDM